MPKSWTEKLNVKKEPKVVKLQESFSDIPADSLMLVATPKLVDDYMKQVPKGHLVDMKTANKNILRLNHKTSFQSYLIDLFFYF